MSEIDVELCLRLDKSNRDNYTSLLHMFQAWQQMAAKLEQGEITKEEYNQWRYKYPELVTSHHFAKVPSKELNDFLVSELKKRIISTKNLTNFLFHFWTQKISKVFLCYLK